jgi:hypothetical protein
MGQLIYIDIHISLITLMIDISIYFALNLMELIYKMIGRPFNEIDSLILSVRR